MAYKVFVAGEEALASDVNSLLMSQAVARFATAAARTAALTTPVLDQLSMLDDRPGYVQYWNGSGWVDHQTVFPAPPTIPPIPKVEWASSVVTTDWGGTAAVNYTSAFPGSHGVVAMNGDSGAQFWVSLVPAAHTASGFVVNCGAVGGPVANGAVRIDWIAVGNP